MCGLRCAGNRTLRETSFLGNSFSSSGRAVEKGRDRLRSPPAPPWLARGGAIATAKALLRHRMSRRARDAAARAHATGGSTCGGHTDIISERPPRSRADELPGRRLQECRTATLSFSEISARRPHGTGTRLWPLFALITRTNLEAHLRARRAAGGAARRQDGPDPRNAQPRMAPWRRAARRVRRDARV